MQLTIEVSDDSPLVKDIQSWKDGSDYELKVRQTEVGMFELLEAEASEPEMEEGEQNNEGGMPSGDGMKSKNPAMVVMIGKVRGGKEKK